MFSNPIIQRYRFSQLRTQNIWVFGTLYIGILLILFFINMSIYSYGEAYSTLQDLFSSMFIQLAVIQMLLSCIFMPMNCSNVIPKEIENKSYDFFRMLPLSSIQKTVGILIGRNLFSLIIVGINFLLCTLFSVMAGISSGLFIQLVVLWIAVSLGMNFASLLLSALSINKSKTTSIPVILLVALFAFGPLCGGLVGAVENEKLQSLSAFFLNFRIPILFLISAYVLCVAMWFFVGILRRFTYEYESLFSFKGAILFLSSYLFLVYALFHNCFFNTSESLFSYHPRDFLFPFFLITLFPVLFIPFLSIRTFDKYIEKSRFANKNDGLVRKLFFNSNLCLGITLFSLWTLSTFCVHLATKVPLLEYLGVSLLASSSYLILICVVESYVVLSPKNEKIGYLLAFFLGLYLVLPMILSGIFENEYLMMFSPIGMIVNYHTYNQLSDILPIAIVNYLFCIVFLLLIRRKYLIIAQLRSYIETQAA